MKILDLSNLPDGDYAMRGGYGNNIIKEFSIVNGNFIFKPKEEPNMNIQVTLEEHDLKEAIWSKMFSEGYNVNRDSIKFETTPTGATKATCNVTKKASTYGYSNSSQLDR